MVVGLAESYAYGLSRYTPQAWTILARTLGRHMFTKSTNVEVLESIILFL
jgi:hypothetical protein